MTDTWARREAEFAQIDEKLARDLYAFELGKEHDNYTAMMVREGTDTSSGGRAAVRAIVRAIRQERDTAAANIAEISQAADKQSELTCLNARGYMAVGSVNAAIMALIRRVERLERTWQP
jgi:thiamine biosynthesis lipoprotein ApbE